MIFPEAIRVVYGQNPLTDVICQLRFPRILAIDERIPADFQRHLGPAYPFVETSEAFIQPISTPADFSAASRVNYQFLTENKDYTVALSSEFIAVSTKKYTKWDDFYTHLEFAMKALSKSYSIPMFTRIGLRYINFIDRGKLGLTDVDWKELIKPSALGLLSDPDVNPGEILEFNCATAFSLPDQSRLTVRTALGQVLPPSKESIFVIDNDFYKEEPIRGSNDAIALCNNFNRLAGRAFRWFIFDRLHNALKPAETN